MASLRTLTSSRSLKLHGCREKKRGGSHLVAVSYVNGDKSEKKHRILIAGGGIAGLVCALAARRSGFDVKVFEKEDSAVRGEGIGRGPIQLLSGALASLQSIDRDVAREIMEVGYFSGHRKTGLADGITGEWLLNFDLLKPALAKGFPLTRMICRMDLQRLLLDAVGDGVLVNNSKVVSFASDADKVTVFLENGDQYKGDLLVGADGIRSLIRSRLLGHQEPKFSGFMCYTGIAEFDPHYFPDFGYKIFMGTRQYFVAVDIGRSKMQWYAFITGSCNGHGSPTEYKSMLMGLFGNWSDEVLTIIGAKSLEDSIIRRPIYDIDMVSTWGRERVVLIGDAAHAMLPNLGQGGSMAIEDCYWLMTELDKLAQRHTLSEIPLHELAMAFRRFEKKRGFRVRTLHSFSRVTSTMTSLYHTYLRIPLLNVSTNVKHPAIHFSKTVLQSVVPKLMDWIIAGQG